jgi:hypothetical protein
MEYDRNFDEVLETRDCGCLIFQRTSIMYSKSTKIDIHYCPKHNAAPDLYKALKDICTNYQKIEWIKASWQNAVNKAEGRE